MSEFNELQNFYRAGSAMISGKINRLDVEKDIIERIKAVEKRIMRINLIKIGIVAIIMTLFFIMFHSFGNLSFLNYLGLAIIFTATIFFIIYYWKTQFRLSGLNHNLPGNEFIIETLVKIQNQKSLFRKAFLFYVIGLICGLNILYLGLLENENTIIRLQFHGVISGLLIALYFLGLKIRARKFRKDFGNLIETLENAKNEF
jgi:hypothetical protein